MTQYIRADLQQVSRSEWRGYLPDQEVFFRGTTRALAEYDAHRVLEEAFGYKSFVILWNEV